MSETNTKLDYKLQYEDFITENQLDVKKFPAAIGKKLRVVKMLVGRYESEPTDNIKQRIIKEDVATANLIADWVERDYPDDIIDPAPTSEEFEDETPPAPVVETPPAPVVETPPAPVVETPPAPAVEVPPIAVVETPPVQVDDVPVVTPEEQALIDKDKALIDEMQQKIMDNKKGNRIKTKVLASIINTEPDYPIQRVGKLALKKVFLSDEYELI